MYSSDWLAEHTDGMKDYEFDDAVMAGRTALQQSSRKLFVGLVVITAIAVLKLMLTASHESSAHYNFSIRREVALNALQEIELSGNYSKRTEQLRKACEAIRHVKHIRYKENGEIHQIYTSKKFNIDVCVIPKSGCTFMKQLMYYLNDPRDWNGTFVNTESEENFYRRIEYIQALIFEIPRMYVHNEIKLGYFQLTLDEFINSKRFKVVLARNPYSRLFSAYIDKFYIPALWGYVVKSYKTRVMQKESSAGYVHIDYCLARFETFENFLETVIMLAEKGQLDVHWGPVSELCAPCRVKPDIVIKQETYQEDVQYLLRKINVNDEQLETINKAIAKQGVQTHSYINGLIKTMFTKGRQGTEGKCISKVGMALRVWNALKIQGQIYQYLRFPYGMFFKNATFDANDVAKIIQTEMKKMPITADESRLQRERSLARAYRNIRPEIIIQIQALYYHDFKMFGYDFNPPTI